MKKLFLRNIFVCAMPVHAKSLDEEFKKSTDGALHCTRTLPLDPMAITFVCANRPRVAVRIREG